MGDVYPKIKAAAIMAAPVFLDREATTEKACRLIREAADQGAELAVFPETFIPGYPFWIWLGSPPSGVPFFAELFKNAVEIPSATTEAIGKAAAQANICVAMGINERAGGTLYNTIVYFDRRGRLVGRHRKLQPTFVERTVWGRGDGSDLVVCDMESFELGGLICWEHTMEPVRYAMVALGEQIHASIWPPISALTHDPHSPLFNDQVQAMACSHAICGQVFVVAVSSVIDDTAIERLGMKDRPDMMRPGGGWSAVINPGGQIIAGPITDREEILLADIDLEEIVYAKAFCDSLGHYARPDVVQVVLNLEKHPVIASRAPRAESLPASGEPETGKEEGERREPI
jgi:aliphatic nitrilase